MWLVVLCIKMYFFKKIIFLVYLDYFNVFILKIILKNKKLLFVAKCLYRY